VTASGIFEVVWRPVAGFTREIAAVAVDLGAGPGSESDSASESEVFRLLRDPIWASIISSSDSRELE
jgi:hypothetical protein